MKTNMLFIEGVLYVRFTALVDCGVPQPTIKMGLQRGQDNWQAIPDPSDQRARLIAYEPLRNKYKEIIKDKYGCPYQYAKMAFIEASMPPLPKTDKHIIDGYELPGGQLLSMAEREKYKRAARILNHLSELIRLDMQTLRDMGFKNASAVWACFKDYIKQEGIQLPASKRLEAKLRKYRKQGAICVIHRNRYNNKNATKVTEAHKMLLAELMADPRKFSIKEVSRQFKAIAAEKGWEEVEDISYRAIHYHVRKLRGQYFRSRHGEKEYMLREELVINQRKASAPNVQWQIDGTPAALWYYNRDKKQLDKLYVVSVSDSHSGATVGYACGVTESTQLVAQAIKMAIQLQGAVPYEVRSDKGSAMTSGETKSLFKNLDILLKPTGTGRARAKSVEGMQRWWMERGCAYYENRSGMNVTAKTLKSKANPELVKANLSKFPISTAELQDQIMESIMLYNNMKGEDGLSPAEKQLHEQPNKREFAADHLVEYFGVFRKKGKKLTQYKFTAEGLEMQIRKEQFRYLPVVNDATEMAAFFAEHNHITPFYVKYDPTDLDEIALYTLPMGEEQQEENLRFHSYAQLKQLAAQVQVEASDDEKATLAYYRQIQKEQHSFDEQLKEKRREYLEAQNILSGSINLQRVHKDALNKAKIDMQRLQSLGHGEVIGDELREEQSKESMKEKKELSINTYLERYED